MNIKVAYDITVLLFELSNPGRKSGIHRVTEEVMYELSKRSDIKLTLLSCCGEELISNALKCSALIKHKQSLATYNFYDVLKSRTGLRKIYNSVYATRYSKEFSRIHKLVPKSVFVKVLHKFIHSFDSYLFLEFKKFDILHSPYYKLPSEEFSQGLPRILTVHDLIPVLAPELVHASLNEYFKQNLNRINYSKDWIICNSEFTRQEFCEYTGMSIKRVFVTPLAAANHFHPVISKKRIKEVRERYDLPEENYFFSLATDLDPRKNLDHLINCFFRLACDYPYLDINLVLAGSKRFRSGEAIHYPDPSKSAAKVIFSGHVEDEDLSALYSGATAFIYPSLYEGFGLPVLEAMCCGTPVIASSTTSLPEVVGDAGILVDPKDEDALCQAMLTLLTDDALCQELSQKGLKRSKTFSWAKCAADTVEVYKTAVLDC